VAADFTVLFLAAFALTLAGRLWLAVRQIRCVRAHRDAVPAGFSERIPLAAHQKAADYTVDRSRLAIVATLAESALLLALTLGGGLAAVHGFWSARLDGLAYGVALIFSVMAISAAVDLPFAIWRQFVIEARHGFNRMTPALFCADLARQAVLALIIGTPLILAVLWMMEAMGEYWWLWVWLFWCAFNLLAVIVFPTWIAPLFNKFSPLPEGEMKGRIEALLARCGFRSSGLFVMDGSKRSSHGNAYFTGFGRSKRIVFFDTLLERLTPPQVEAVLAHELGHFARRHIVKRIVFLFAGSLAFLWLLGRLIDAPWFYAGLGVPAQGTALALLLFMLVVPVFTFPLAPLASALSRRHEFEADAYAAEVTGDGAPLAGALKKMTAEHLSHPSPAKLRVWLDYSHPPLLERLRALRKTA
jgi:STE24 endopeptidase